MHFIIKWNWSRSRIEDILYIRKYLRQEGDVSLNIKMVGNNLYEVNASPPHVKAAWSSERPMSARMLIEELRSRGCHQQDIGDAMYEQDPGWIEKLDNE